jgi:cytochrome P450
LSTSLNINLADPGLYERGEGEGAWSVLRAECPVYRNVAEDIDPFWAVTRYEDASRVLRDPRTFCSSRGMRVGAPPASVSAASERMLIATDPPRHGKIRGILSASFVPRAARERHDRIGQIADRVVTAMLADEDPVDFPTAVVPLPAGTLCDLLGVPAADWDYIAGLTGLAFGEQSNEGIDGDLEKTIAHTELFGYLHELAAAKRSFPGEDVVSRLVGATVDGVSLSDDEILLNCEGVINGGVETTRHAASRGVLGFLGTAVEEILRWATPPLMVMRHATRDVEIGAVRIGAGEAVVVVNGSANRDEDAFLRADRLEIDRRSNRHLSFGLGPHFCIGAALAKIELTALFGALSRRVTAIEPAGPARHLRSNFIWGLASLPVVLQADR